MSITDIDSCSLARRPRTSVTVVTVPCSAPPAVPASPDNLALTTMEYRSFFRDGKLQVKYQRTYYHVSKSCVREKNRDFLSTTIVLEDCSQLDAKQREKLNKEFGLKLQPILTTAT